MTAARRGRYLGADDALDGWDDIGNAEEIGWGEDDETRQEIEQAEQLAAADVDWDAREMSD